MPKKYGVKEKDLVVAHVVNLVLTGKLRSGDRLDRNEIAEELGLSRVPIQEAVVQLEHDGMLSTRYHRGAYVERFDEGVVREHHELYGVLNGIASARAAADPEPEDARRARGIARALRAAASRGRSGDRVAATASDQRRVRRPATAGRDPRRSDVDAAHLLDGLPGQPRELLRYYEAETVAIRDRDPDAARTACEDRAEVMGRIMLAELVRRRVLAPPRVRRAIRCILNERKPHVRRRRGYVARMARLPA